MRFPNITGIGKYTDDDIPAIEHAVRNASDPSVEPPNQDICWTIEQYYCLGREIESICRLAGSYVDFWSARMELLLDEFDEEYRQKLRLSELSVMVGLEYCALIDDRRRLERLTDLCARMLSNKRRYSLKMNWAFMDMLVRMGRKQPCEEDCLSGVISELGSNILAFHQRVILMARKDIVGFNTSLQNEVLQICGTERSRKRKKEAAVRQVFRIELLRQTSFALHCGIPLTFRDSAIPVWDFPIARREDVAPLLPPPPGEP